MAVKSGDGIVVIPTDELMGKISDLMDNKLSAFAQTMKEISAAPADEWLKINDFCSINKMSKSHVYRLIRDGKIDVRELSPRNKFYRWSDR